MANQLDILAFGAHPDDVELCCSGTVLRQISLGQKVGVVDLTRGELGTRGNAQIRAEEAKKAARIMGISVRENLGLADGFFAKDEDARLKVVRMIRKYRPAVILANAIRDRHPDHGRAAKLVAEASFLSGLEKVITQLEDEQQEKWRPQAVYFYIQDRYIEPDFVVDISPFMEKKLEAIRAYKSQFFDAASQEPDTPISAQSFLDLIVSRAQYYARQIGVEYAEGFTVERPPGVGDILSLL